MRRLVRATERLVVAAALAACGAPAAPPQPLAGVRVELGHSPLATIGLPVPPHQQDPWTPGAALPAELAAAVATLFDQGLADPRRLSYRTVELVVGDGATVRTRGWVFDRDRHAVAWNGLVYPVASIGVAADVHADAARLLAAPIPNGPRWNEADAVAFDQPGPLKIAILARLGEDVVAAALANAIKGDRYLTIARSWIYALWDRAITARKRGDHRSALASARGVAIIKPAIEAEATRRALPPPHLSGLELLPRLIADQQRLVTTVRTPMPDAAALAAMSEPARLALLIERLDTIEMGSHGFGLWRDPIFIPALVQIGASAVEPLIAVIESDPRLTSSDRSNPNLEHLEILGVEEAAYQALAEILDRSTRDFEPDAGRERRAAAIRAYWTKWRDVTVEERWYRTLADDQADPHHQVMAALSIVQPSALPRRPGLRGEVLRSHAPPSVSSLLEHRIDKAADISNACYLAGAYHRWSPATANPALTRLMTRVIKAAGTGDSNGSCISDLAKLRAASGDLAGVDDYARWIRQLLPVPDDWVSPLIFGALSTYMTRKSVIDAVSFLFRDGSPWLPLVDPTGAHDLGDLLHEPLIAIPALTKQVLVGLADVRPYGNLEMTEARRYHMKRLVRGGGLESTIDPSAPSVPPRGTTHVVRVCDWIAYSLVNYRSNTPRYELYWPQPQRDAAIAALRVWLQAQVRP